jgi:acetyl-CoA carboxylase biotin carboxyl carrier protein
VTKETNAVADDASSKPGPFDARTIRFLVGLMSRHDLSEIDLSEGDQRIRLRRGPRTVAALPSTVLPSPVAAVPAHPTAPTPAAPTPAAPTRHLIDIKSPGPGTFYAAEKPDLPPYVTRGSRVTPSTVVGLIEAMKLYNEILAECSGVIVEVLVENGQPIEYNQVMFRVDPAG